MDVIGRDHVVQHAQSESLARLVKPMHIVASVASELQKKFALVAAMSEMPDMAGQEVAVGTRHRFLP